MKNDTEKSNAPALAVDEGSGSFQALSPFSWPTAEARSRWHGDELIWTINGRDVTDKALRSWCYINLNYPWCYVDVVRQYHVNAWAARNSPNNVHDPRGGEAL